MTQTHSIDIDKKNLSVELAFILLLVQYLKTSVTLTCMFEEEEEHPFQEYLETLQVLLFIF